MFNKNCLSGLKTSLGKEVKISQIDVNNTFFLNNFEKMPIKNVGFIKYFHGFINYLK